MPTLRSSATDDVGDAWDRLAQRHPLQPEPLEPPLLPVLASWPVESLREEPSHEEPWHPARCPEEPACEWS